MKIVITFLILLISITSLSQNYKINEHHLLEGQERGVV